MKKRGGSSRAKRRFSRREHARFPRREDKIEHIEVHVAGICLRRQRGSWSVLAAKRSSNRSLFPDKWECGGGMVRPGEDFRAAIKRQMFEEFGLEVEPTQVLDVYEIHVATAQKVIPGVRVLCLAPTGRVKLNKREFSTYRWLRFPLTESIDWIDGIYRLLERLSAELSEKTTAQVRDAGRRIGF